MVDYTVFYSWQYDSPRNCNMNFIEDCIKRGLKQINRKVDLELAPRLDRDPRGLPGTPPIADTVLRKIRESGVIIADLTLVGYADQHFTLWSLFAAWLRNRLDWNATIAGIHQTK